uniref:Uncharacterized protein n=1 Tax=Arundo donax TaxID=35708 RepID=A0A0A8ZQC7_ARUDO
MLIRWRIIFHTLKDILNVHQAAK